MTANLVLHWHLDALTPENRAVDSSDNHLNGTVSGDPRNQPDERFGSVLSFNGTTDAVTVPDTPLLRLASYTVEAWLNPATAGNPHAGVAGKPPNDFRMILGADGSLAHRFSTTANADEGHATGPGAVPPGAWRHVAIVNDGHTAGIYLDGKQASAHPFTGERTVAQVPLQVATGGASGTGYAGLLAHVRVYDGPLTETEIQRDMADDEAALAVFVRAHPIGFSLTDVSGQPVLFIDDAPAGQPMTLELANTSRQDIELQPLTGPVSAASHHLALHFRPGILAIPPQPAMTATGWSLLADLDPATGGRVLYLASANPVTIPRGTALDLTLTGLNADGTGGTRGTRVELTYQGMRYAGEPDELIGQRLAFLDVVNQRGRRQIPLAIGFVGGNRVLNDGVTANTLRIRIANRSRDTALSLTGASFTLSYDVQEANETHEWALSDAGQAGRAVLGGLVADQVSADWAINRENLGQRVEWTLTPRTSTAFGPDGSIVVTLSQVFALVSLGQAGIVIGWQNVPGYADGSVTLLVEKSPLMFAGQNTGIGTPSPGYGVQLAVGKALRIEGGTGSSDSTAYFSFGGNGAFSIDAPEVPGGRFVVQSSGNVGIGTAGPGAKLQVVGGGGTSVDLVVSGRLRSDNNDGGLWVAQDRFIGGFGTNKVGLYNGSAFRLSVLSTGDVGVGTVQPAGRLHVNVDSSGTPVNAMRIDVQGFQTAANASASHFLAVRDISAGNNGNHFLIRGDGNVGIGHPNPAFGLHLATGKELRIDGGSSPSDAVVYFSFGGNGAFSIDAAGVPGGRLMVQNSGDVGIGTAQPASRLHVNLYSSSSPVKAMQIDVESFVTLANARASHFLLVRDTGITGDGTHFLIRGDGSVGIGTADTGNQKLCVQGPTWLKGDLFVNGRLLYYWSADNAWKVINNRAGNWAGSSNDTGPNTSDASDVRLKADLRPIRHALEAVRQLRGVRYRWGDAGLDHFTRDIEDSLSAGPDATDEQNRRLRQAARRKALDELAGDRLGLVAQEVETVLPELVRQDEDGYKHIRYEQLTAVLIEAIKEQDAVLRELSAKIAGQD
jgi:Concanavalin A-like lectin/glucanases superfamily/Chaperone of endosialidase